MKASTKDFVEAYKAHFKGNIAEFHQHLVTNYGYTQSSKSSTARKIARLKSIGALPLEAGVSVEHGTVLTGMSRYHKLEDGGVWVKSDVEKSNQLTAFKDAVESLLTNVRQPLSFISPATTNHDKITIYTIGDAHIGMLAHKAETGNDNDLKIAEADLRGGMTILCEQSTPTHECFIIDVGDWFHSDNQSNTTSKSNNKLDVDGRYHKVLEVGLRLITELIDLALTKHELVRWRSAIGNHDEHSSIMATAFVKAYYRNEPRVVVHDTPNPFMYFQFGKNLIGVTHGHTIKADKLGEVMSVDCEDIWSSTKYRFWYTGHVHHLSTKEYPSCVVETFRTLAGKDAWHSTSGYRSGQDMKAITLHKDFGEISRNTVNINAILSERTKQQGA